MMFWMKNSIRSINERHFDTWRISLVERSRIDIRNSRVSVDPFRKFYDSSPELNTKNQETWTIILITFVRNFSIEKQLLAETRATYRSQAGNPLSVSQIDERSVLIIWREREREIAARSANGFTRILVSQRALDEGFSLGRRTIKNDDTWAFQIGRKRDTNRSANKRAKTATG